jgi:hypothetical protein
LLRQPGGGAGRSLAIFVHGFLGDYLTTWGRLPELLVDNVQNEAALARWDFLFLGYPTRKVGAYLDIAHLIGTQWGNAAAGRPPFGASYTRLALLAHSLGTLGVRQLLCAVSIQPPNMLQALKSITLFGTPLNGSPLASIGKLFGGEIAEALKPANSQLRMLKRWNESMQPRLHWPAVRVILGTDDQVVGYKYSDLINFAGDAEPSQLLASNHRDLVKPQSWNGSRIRDEIVGALQ